MRVREHPVASSVSMVPHTTLSSILVIVTWLRAFEKPL
jgi:hypothetical protein